MTYKLTVDAVDQTSVVPFGRFRLGGEARMGESSTGSMDWDDDAAGGPPAGLKIVRLTEDASGAEKHLARMRIRPVDSARGDTRVPIDAAQYAVGLEDSNSDLYGLRLLGSRDAETDVARVLWIVANILNGSSSTATTATKRASTVIGTTYVPNTNTVTMPAREYSDPSDPWSAIEECARAAGKTFFVIVLDDGSMELFYDVPTSTAYASDISITDSGADSVDSYAPIFEGAAATRDWEEFASGGGLIYADGQVVTERRAAAEAAHDVWEEVFYDGGAADATDAATRLAAFLDERAEAEMRVHCKIRMEADQVHRVKQGMTLSFRAAAAAITTPTTLRVASCYYEVARDADVPRVGLYDVDLWLGFPQKMRPRIADHGKIQVVARQAATPPTEADATFAEGSALATAHWFARLDEGSDPTAWDDDAAKAGWIPGFILGTGFAEELNASFAQCFPDNDAVRGRTQGFLQVVASTAGVTRPTDAVFGRIAFTLRTYEAGFVDPGDGLKAMGGFHRNPVASDVEQMRGPYELRILPGGGALDANDVLVGRSFGSIGSISDTPVAFEIDIPIAAIAFDDANGIRFMVAPLFTAPGGWACWADINDGHVVGGHARVVSTSARIVTVASPGWITGFPEGTQDGDNTVFTLPGGTLEEVEELYVNGIAVPPTSYDVDTGADELTTIGWAPVQTDLLSARYRVS